MKNGKKLVIVALVLFLCSFVSEIIAVYPVLCNTLFNANLSTLLNSTYAMLLSELGLVLVFVALILAIIGVSISQN
jgi:uncharacterized membrane protein